MGFDSTTKKPATTTGKRGRRVTVLQFPESHTNNPISTVQDRADAIQKMLADVRFDSISRQRTILLCEAINQAFHDDAFGLEAILTLIRAIADPEGDPEKFSTAQTALFEITIGNLK